MNCMHYLCTEVVTRKKRSTIMKYPITRSLLTILAFAFAILSITSCNKSKEEEKKDEGPCFTICGTVNDAEGKVIYLANESLNGTAIIDSATIAKDGKFSFSKPGYGTYEFFIVGFQEETPVVIAIDSTETVTLTANSGDISTCSIEGSPESLKIREMSELVTALEQQISGMKPDASYLAKKAALVDEFKENIAKQYIIPSPDKASAYFALWLMCKGQPLFDPFTNRMDSKYYAGVATSMKRMFPQAERTKHISDIAERGIKLTRTISNEEAERLDAITTIASTNDLFEITLPDRSGNQISLSSLKGKAVLLDFTFFDNSKIKMRNIDLRELHDRYSKRGFEIYQVSLDTRKHYWQQEVLGLPWICVNDERSGESPYLVTYNIQSIPTFFLIDKEGEIVLRDAQIDNLTKEIEKLLKK